MAKPTDNTDNKADSLLKEHACKVMAPVMEHNRSVMDEISEGLDPSTRAAEYLKLLREEKRVLITERAKVYPGVKGKTKPGILDWLFHTMLDTSDNVQAQRALR